MGSTKQQNTKAQKQQSD